MKPRYLLVMPYGEDAQALACRLAEVTGLHLAWCTPALAILTNERCACLGLEGQGAVLGTLFHRHGPARAITEFGASERQALVRAGADLLLRSYWGGHVSIWASGDAVTILRDPSGALPCYRGSTPAARLFASDLDLLLAAGVWPGGIDWQATGFSLFSNALPVERSALEGVTILLPGVALELCGRSETAKVRWSPWDFVASPDYATGIEPGERLRRVVQHSVAAWASCFARPLVSVSGGLDSSIVAACLAEADAAASCITLFTDDAAGDEREFARALCTHLGLPLFERRFALDQVDIARPLGMHLPRPFGRAQVQSYERAHLEAARDAQCDAFFTGNGGDNVFGYSQSAAALVDRVRFEGVGAGAFSTLGDICRQTGAGYFRVALSAIRGSRRPPGYAWKPNRLFLHAELARELDDATLGHPWLAAPAHAAPAKAAHIAGLVRVQANLEPERSAQAPVINPLLSQPVIEACLAIPSWEWRRGGRDRAVARAAFAADLPDAVRDRRVKGTPDPFCAEIVRQYRGKLREALLDGQLADRRLIDREAIEQALTPDRSLSGEARVRLLELANVEAWVRAWTQRLASRSHAVPV